MCILKQFFKIEREKKNPSREVWEAVGTSHEVTRTQHRDSSHMPHRSVCKETMSFLGGSLGKSWSRNQGSGFELWLLLTDDPWASHLGPLGPGSSSEDTGIIIYS